MDTTEFLAEVEATCIVGRWYVMRSPSDRPHVATSRDGNVHLTAVGEEMRDALLASPPAAGTKPKTSRKAKAQPLAPPPMEIDVDDAGASDQLELQGLDTDPDGPDPTDVPDETEA